MLLSAIVLLDLFDFYRYIEVNCDILYYILILLH